MRLESSRRLRGPNRYLSRPVQVSVVLLDDLTERETGPHFAGRLLDTLPGLAQHHCAAGRPGGFVERLLGGTYFGHVAEHVAIELSHLIGRPVNFGRTSYAGAPGRYEIVVECPLDEPVASTVPDRLLTLAMRLIEGDAGLGGLDDIRAAHEAERPGPSTAAIAAAARARDIPVERVGSLSLLRLGHGRHRRLVWAAMTDATSAVGVDIAGDKQLTRELLDAAGVPVPAGGVALTVGEALRWYAELGPPVVVKPRSGSQGANVFLGVDSPSAVREAFAAANAEDGVVVERQLAGRDYRVLVVGGRVVAAAERVAAHVVGDGHTPVRRLVDIANGDPRRGTGHDRPLTRLSLDTTAMASLDRQRLDADAVPANGRIVWLRDNANLSTGGTSEDVTDLVHADVADLCRRVAAVVGLDVAGIDLRLPDIAAPLPPCPAGPANNGVIEVNAAPGLRMHLSPTHGLPRDAGRAIVDALYPPGAPSRVPTVAVTGTNGKTTTARLTAHLLAAAGQRVGLTTTDGVYVGSRLIQVADATGPRSAQVVLGDPTVDVAVLETARGGILRQGLGYDRSDVGVITNIAADHLGQDGLDRLDDLVDVKSLVAERVRGSGAVVLNADCPVSRDLATGLPRRRVVWYSLDGRDAFVRAHWIGGGRAYVLADGWLVELDDRRRVPLLAVTELPGAYGGAAPYAVANALAACAAARELGVTAACVREGLRSFQPAAENPGRAQLVRVGEVDVLVDYAHNPAAIAAVGDLVHRVWGRERAIAVVTLPGDRRDDLLAESGRTVADRFDRIVLYEDADLRGRRPGEVPGIVRAGIDAPCTVVSTVEDAVAAALTMARPGDVVLLLYEKIAPVLVLLAEADAVTGPARFVHPEMSRV